MFVIIGIWKTRWEYTFLVRGYPKKLVDNQLRRVVENRPEQLPEH